jgi:hypothetical protein
VERRDRADEQGGSTSHLKVCGRGKLREAKVGPTLRGRLKYSLDVTNLAGFLAVQDTANLFIMQLNKRIIAWVRHYTLQHNKVQN